MTLLSNYNIMASPKKEVAVKKSFENAQVLNKKFIIHNRSALHELEIPRDLCSCDTWSHGMQPRSFIFQVAPSFHYIKYGWLKIVNLKI